LISARTGVVVAPVVMAGYSLYHSGFPGTLSLKPETMEEVLWHAGVEETSEMLFFEPGLVRMERAEKSNIHFTPQMDELRELDKKNPELRIVWESLFGVPTETKKGGASHELSSNGVWCLSDPKAAKPEIGEKLIKTQVDLAVKFIEAWTQAKK
jgi:creatinine amidohydrolase/Fe(II)-dependent formamide hydrolase-like protein